MKKGLPDHGPDAGVGGQCGLQGLRLEPLVQDLHVHGSTIIGHLASCKVKNTTF